MNRTKGAALVQHQPAALDRQVKASLVFVRRALLAKQERPVDQLDVDPALPHDLDAVGARQRQRAAPFEPPLANMYLRDFRSRVRDTGHGLRPESLPRLFEPFYTTKPNGMGKDQFLNCDYLCRLSTVRL